jgi:hypothetical protein
MTNRERIASAPHTNAGGRAAARGRARDPREGKMVAADPGARSALDFPSKPSSGSAIDFSDRSV